MKTLYNYYFIINSFIQGIFSNEFMNKLDSEIKVYDDSKSYNSQLRYGTYSTFST